MIATLSSTRFAATPATCAALAAPLANILSELRSVVAGLSDAEFTARMGPCFSNSTIGGHVRHALDHARALIDGRRAGIVDYDHRERGTVIESSSAAAAAELARLLAATQELCAAESAEPLAVGVMPTRDGEPISLESTLARELAFVLSHTIHHNATIRGMVVSLGLPVPASLGYAPSTLAHQDATACVR